MNSLGFVENRVRCRGLLPEKKQHEAIAGVERLIAEFARIAKGVMMLGERLSAYLMARHMEAEGMHPCKSESFNGSLLRERFLPALFSHFRPSTPHARRTSLVHLELELAS